MIGRVIWLILSCLHPAQGLSPCANEDGSGGPLPCVWDAQHVGNHVGQSFVITDGGVTIYLVHAHVTFPPEGGTNMGCDDGYIPVDDDDGYPAVRCERINESLRERTK